MKELIHIILYQPLYNALIFLVDVVPGHSLGLAIIILTILIRAVLWQSSAKGVLMQKKMRSLQPQLEEIKQKYKNDKQAQTAATLELYKEHRVNPIGTCLPLLIQLPIFYVLYVVFRNGINESGFNDLYSFVSRPEAVNTAFFGINLTTIDPWILPIIAGLAQFWQSKQLLPKPTGLKTDKMTEKEDMSVAMTKQMTYIFPIMFVFIARSLPAALPLYWATNSLFGVFQQWYIMDRKSEQLLEKGDTTGYTAKKGVKIQVRKRSAKKD